MTSTPEELMPLIAPGGFAAPDNSESRYLVRLGDIVFGHVLKTFEPIYANQQHFKNKQPPANHHIEYKHVLVAEVGSDDYLYVYHKVPAWVINGIEVGNYSCAEYLGSARAPTKDNPHNRANLANRHDFNKYIHRITPVPLFHWYLGVPELDTILAKLRQDRIQNSTLDSSLVPPPAKLSMADKKWQQVVKYTQLKGGKIDCTIEVVDKTRDREKSTSGRRVQTDVNNQRAFDLHSTFEDVLSYATKIQVYPDDTDQQSLKSLLAETGYGIELWVLPQKYDGKVYEWKKDSNWELYGFLDSAVWKEHKQLYVEAHITQGKAKVVESVE